jgi:hypothetical protein
MAPEPYIITVTQQCETHGDPLQFEMQFLFLVHLLLLFYVENSIYSLFLLLLLLISCCNADSISYCIILKRKENKLIIFVLKTLILMEKTSEQKKNLNWFGTKQFWTLSLKLGIDWDLQNVTYIQPIGLTYLSTTNINRFKRYWLLVVFLFLHYYFSLSAVDMLQLLTVPVFAAQKLCVPLYYYW